MQSEKIWLRISPGIILKHERAPFDDESWTVEGDIILRLA